MQRVAAILTVVGTLTGAPPAAAQTRPSPAPGSPATAGGIAFASPGSTAVTADYRIGPDDVLSILFWRDKEMSADVIVRPGGKITLPLINEIDAVGLTPDELRDRVAASARRFVEDANVTVVVKQINSRKVFITGQVEKPGAYALTAPTTVVQLIALAGGLREFANGRKILIVRVENGKQVSHRFNYDDLVNDRDTLQNIELRPRDTVVVP